MKIAAILPILAIAFTALAAVEVPIAPVREGAAVLSQYAESGATDGSDYLFVWVDGRTGGYERRATRVTRDGEVLDRDGIRLPFVYERNSVVWTGSSWLIVWGEGYPSSIRAVRIDRDGRIIDGPRTLKEEAAPMSVISNGEHVVIAYHTHKDPYGAFDKRALFLDADAGIEADVVLDEPGNRGSANLAWNGSHFAAVWVDYNPDVAPYAIEGIRFNISGTIDAAPRRLFEDSSDAYVATPSIASDGTNFLLVTRAADDRQVARTLSADLATVGAPQLLPALDYELMPHLNLSSSILWNGSSYLILGHDHHAISAVRLNRDGALIRSDVIESASAGVLANPVAATNGLDLLVAWTGQFSSDPDVGSDVFGTVVSASTFDPKRRTLLSVGPQHQRGPVIASGGTNLLAVWQEGLASYARRLTPEGTPLDAAPLLVAERGTPTAVVFNGSDYIVVWPRTAAHSIVGLEIARVPRDGALRVEGHASLAGVVPLAAASDGVTTLLLWSRENVLYAGRVGADGSLAGEALALTGAENEAVVDRAAIAARDGEFLIAWEEGRAHDMIACPPILSYGIRGARVTAGLVSLDPGGFDLAMAGENERSPAIAWNGREWLVVWNAYVRNGGVSGPELRGRRVSRDGVVRDAAEGVFIASEGNLPSVTWDGTRYFLVWHDTSHGAKLHTTYLPDLGQATSRETVIEKLYDWTPVSLAALRPGLVVAAYARTTAEAAYGDVSRAFLNFVPITTRRRAVR